MMGITQEEWDAGRRLEREEREKIQRKLDRALAALNLIDREARLISGERCVGIVRAALQDIRGLPG